jgi:pimeloyl-ACP methyl ester carboxylesterase
LGAPHHQTEIAERLVMNPIVDSTVTPATVRGSNITVTTHERIIGGMPVFHLVPSTILAKEPMLFVHGMCFDGKSFLRMARLFARLGYECYVVTLRGYPGGKYAPDPGKVLMGHHVSDIRTLIGHLGRSVIGVGHSLGPVVLAHVAKQFPDLITRLVDLTPPPPADPMSKLAQRKVLKPRYLFALFLGKPLRLDAADAQVLFFNTFSISERREHCSNLHAESGWSALQRASTYYRMIPVSQPRLIVAAERDQMVGTWTEEAAADLGADLRRVDCSHVIPLDPHVAEAVEVIHRWLN